MQFPTFNKLTNPNDDPCYIAMVSGKSPRFMRYKDISALANIEPTLEIGWLIPQGYLVIETNTTAILPTIRARAEQVMIVESNNKLQIYCKTKRFDRTTTNNIAACGINIDTYGYSKKGQASIVLPFKKSNNVSPLLSSMTIPYSNGIEQIPIWLTPLRKISADSQDGLEIPITNNAQTLLLSLYKRLRTIPADKQRGVLELVNSEFCASPVTPDELNHILSVGEELVLKQFFDKEKFLHNKMGDYIIETCNIKRDIETKELLYYNEKDSIYSNDTEYLLGYMTKLCPALKAYQKEEVMKYVEQSLYNDSVQFNANPFTVVFSNGLLDVRNIHTELMTPDKYETIKINCAYNPNAKSPVVDEFFQTITNGNTEVEQLLYEAIGYSMLKTSELQKAFILLGPGRNGKSTYLDLIRAVLGKQNTTSISFRDLSNNFRASALIGKLASLAGDASNQPIQDSEIVKSIAVGENIMLERKYKEATDQINLFSTMFFACNRLPRTPDTSDGFYRRWSIIPFLAKLESVTRVNGLIFKQKLLAPESLEYVAYKAVKAIHKVLTTTEDFIEPQVVKDLLKDYKTDNSSTLSWFKEVLKSNKDALIKMSAKAAYISYVAWCEEAGRGRSSQTKVLNDIKTDLGIDLK